VLGRAATVFAGRQQSMRSFRGRLFPGVAGDLLRQRHVDRKHEIRRKREAGVEGTSRGAAALNAAGAALGALGMLAVAGTFSLLVEKRRERLASLAFRVSGGVVRRAATAFSLQAGTQLRPRDLAEPLKFQAP
jgi:hypothetical protein